MSRGRSDDREPRYSPEEIAEAEAQTARDKAYIAEKNKARQDSKRVRDKRALHEAYHEVYQTEHRDPFDRLYKFPDWVPGYFISVHRRFLKQLLKVYSKEEIEREYERYKSRLTSDHANRSETGRCLSVAIHPSLIDEFRELAHILWALEIGKDDRSDAGLHALLGDPEEVRYWLQGRNNVAAVKRGGAAKRDKYQLINQHKAREYEQEAIQYRKSHPTRNFTAACVYIAKEKKCSPSQIRKMLQLVGITAITFKEI
jgi:hypothetical protein